MPKTREVVYVRHPVTPERKAELKKAGYRILDIRYAPAGYIAAGKEQAAECRAQHRGKGRWYVMRGDGIVSGPYAKGDVEAAVEREKASP